METTKLNFVLMGKSGQGKSSTGNTIVNIWVFRTSFDASFKTEDVSFCSAQFEKYGLMVVDGPGLEDTDIDKAQDRITAVKNMDRFLDICYGAVDTFLFVIMFGQTFTDEDNGKLEALGRIYGERFMEHVIVVVTCGDRFQTHGNEGKTPGKSFHEWCRNQKGAFLRLYESCEGRFVLFNNREIDMKKKRAQILEVIQHARELQTRSGRYTTEYFKMAEYKIERQILQLKDPRLIDDLYKKIWLLSAAIDDLTSRPSHEQTVKLRLRVRNLRNEIEQHYKSYQVLRGLLMMMLNVEENMTNAEKRGALIKEMEEIRKGKATCCVLGPVCTIAGVAIAVVAPLLGISVVVGSILITFVAYLILTVSEENKDRQLHELASKKKL